ncbi:MAG: hypothetical protein NDI63_09330 [Pseudobdellovibrio sp.]|nr:hypothetical protein [Pseudobdellovibrio sp.]
MRLKNKLSLLLISALCTMSLHLAHAQETPPDVDTPVDTPDDTTTVDKDKVKKKLRADFFLDFDWGEEVINLTPHPKNSEFFESASDTLVMGDYSKGFRVVKYSEVSAGLGGKLTWNWPNKTGLAGKFWLYVGLMPMAGKTAVTNQFQPSFEKAMNAKSRKIPMEASDLNAWAVEDSVNYSTTGGLIFSVGVGVPGVNVGTDFIVQGTFSTYVEKTSADEVYVMISNTDAKSLVMQVDATVAQVGVTKYKEIEQGMSYMIKFKDPVGQKAYHDLIRGNVAAIQMLLADPNQTAIQKWEKLNRMQLRKLAHFNFGIPFIMTWGWTAGKIYEFSDTRAYYDNTRAEVDYGVYVKEKRKKIFGSMAVKTESFYGSVYRLYSYDNDLITKYIFGQYIFNADDNKTKTKDMNKTINNLIEKTGLSQQLALNIAKYKKLKFSRINLEVNFDEDQTLRFMEAAARMTPEMIAARANQIANNFIMSESTSLALCTPEETEVPMSTDACLAKYMAENTEVSSSLVKAARVMKTHFQAGRDKEFSMAYAEFGRAMLKNATMFQAILGMAGSGAEIVYNVQNTYFQNYRVIYVTTDQPGVYIRKVKGQKDTFIFADKYLNDAVNVASGF